jgi:hypothetical protein
VAIITNWYSTMLAAGKTKKKKKKNYSCSSRKIASQRRKVKNTEAR